MALLVKDRDAGTSARVALEADAPMSLELDARPRRGRPPARNEILRAGRLGGLTAGRARRRFGTPLYVYDLDVIERQVTTLQAALPARVDLAYAVKANPALAVVEFLGRLGLGADVASGGELATARRAGIAADRIVMTGPGKRDAELAAAVAAGIRAVTVESPGELARLERIAADAGRVQPVLLRAAVSEHARLERVRLVGDDGAGKFGMDAADLADVGAARGRLAASRAARAPRLRGIEHPRRGRRSWRTSRRRSAPPAAWRCRPARHSGWSTPAADSGSRTSRTRNRSTWSRLGAGLAEITSGWDSDPVLSGARLLLEPGRFLVGPAGAYLARVVDRKTVDGTVVVILDGGVHHVLRPALVGQEHRLRAFSGHGDGAGTGGWPDGAGHRGRSRCARVSMSSASRR